MSALERKQTDTRTHSRSKQTHTQATAHKQTQATAHTSTQWQDSRLRTV